MVWKDEFEHWTEENFEENRLYNLENIRGFYHENKYEKVSFKFNTISHRITTTSSNTGTRFADAAGYGTGDAIYHNGVK